MLLPVGIRARLAALPISGLACLPAVFLPFFLVTAVFESFAVIDLSPASFPDPADAVEIRIDDRGHEVIEGGGHARRLPRSFGRLDTPSLARALGGFGRDGRHLIVAPEDGVPLQEIIETVDAARDVAFWIVSVRIFPRARLPTALSPTGRAASVGGPPRGP